MSPALTTILAVWGAVLSTVTVIWNLWRWRQEKPLIVAKAMLCGTGKDKCIRIEIRNRGGRPTTLEDVWLVKYMDGIAGLLRFQARTTYLAAKFGKRINLPVMLAAGGVWKEDVPLWDGERTPSDDDREELVEKGLLYFKVCCAHTDRRVAGKVMPESFSLWG